MHFLLLGATGRTGKHVLSTLLSEGHTATALIRTPGTLPPQPGLTLITGTPLSLPSLTAALSASPLPVSAAIVTLNTVRKSDSPFAAQLSPRRFLADSVANLCEVLQGAGVQRVVVMSTAGVGDSWARLPWVSRVFMGWTNIKYALEDHGAVDREMRGREGVEWTLVRAVRLEFGEEKGGKGKGEVKTLGSEGVGMKMTDSVNVASVARVLVRVAVGGEFVGEAVVVRD